MIFSGSIGDVLFFGSLDVSVQDYSTVSSIISIFMCVVMFLACIAVLFMSFYIVKDARKTTSEEGKWRDFEIFFAEANNATFLGYAYMPLFLVRSALFNLIIANLYNYPLVQAFMIYGLSLFMLIYFFRKTPLKNFVALFQNILNELLINVTNGCVLALAIMDKAEVERNSIRTFFGNIIVKINVIFSMLGLGFLVVQLILSAMTLYAISKSYWSAGVRNPMRMAKIMVKRLAYEEEEEEGDEKDAKAKKTEIETNIEMKTLGDKTALSISVNDSEAHLKQRTMEDAMNTTWGNHTRRKVIRRLPENPEMTVDLDTLDMSDGFSRTKRSRNNSRISKNPNRLQAFLENFKDDERETESDERLSMTRNSLNGFLNKKKILRENDTRSTLRTDTSKPKLPSNSLRNNEKK